MEFISDESKRFIKVATIALMVFTAMFSPLVSMSMQDKIEVAPPGLLFGLLVGIPMASAVFIEIKKSEYIFDNSVKLAFFIICPIVGSGYIYYCGLPIFGCAISLFIAIMSQMCKSFRVF